MNSKMTLPLVFALTTLLANTVVSSDAQYQYLHQQRGPMSFEMHDLNKDGVISANEFSQARMQRHAVRQKAGYQLRNANKAPVFENIDQDNNGIISRDELSSWHKYRLSQRR